MSDHRIKDLKETIMTARKELNTITDVQDKIKDAEFLGKCFKFKNCYSCPGKPEDYWWIYKKVVSAESGLHVFCFQMDCNGMIRIEPDRFMMRRSLKDCEPISKTELTIAWASLTTKINSLV